MVSETVGADFGPPRMMKGGRFGGRIVRRTRRRRRAGDSFPDWGNVREAQHDNSLCMAPPGVHVGIDASIKLRYAFVDLYSSFVSTTFLPHMEQMPFLKEQSWQ